MSSTGTGTGSPTSPTPPNDCPCDSNNTTGNPIRYGDGEIIHSEHDLAGGGFGINWGHTREYCNQLNGNVSGANGNNWMLPYDAYLVFNDAGQITVVRGVQSSLWFNQNGSEWEPQYGANFSLVLSEEINRYILTDLDSGLKQYFYDNSTIWSAGLRGRLNSLTAAGGQEAYINRDESTGRITSFVAVSGETSVSYTYVYNSTGKLSQVNQLNEGGTRVVNYTYYDSSESFGNYGDLKKVVVANQVGNGPSPTFQTLRTHYYRYYKPGETGGYTGGLRYIIGPDAWQAMVDAAIPPETATDEQIRAYASNLFEYDGQRRVTKEVVDGGLNTTLLSYSITAFPDSPNNWKYKTIETRPDGSTVTVYSNWLFQVLFKIWAKDGNEWYEYKQYNNSQKRILRATSDAVQSYEETATGLSVVLKDSVGLLEIQSWYNSTDNATGAAKDQLEFIGYEQGIEGVITKQKSYKYFTQDTGNYKQVVPVESVTYRSEAGGGSDPVTTQYAYLFYSGTSQYSKRTTTLPVVSTAENGDGVTYTIEELFDTAGRLIWKRDQLGFITQYSYVATTGALAQKIEDVNSSLVTGCPWTTPTGGGLHLVTNYESDFLGRQILELGPSHEVSLSGVATTLRSANFTVYRDDIDQVWEAAGYATGSAGAYSYTTIDPVSITVRDGAKRITQKITTSRSGSGRLSSADSFPQSSYLSWTVNHYNDYSQLSYKREYFNIPSSGDGLNGTHYLQTNYGYDSMENLNRIQSPGGTITRRIFDTLGNLVEEWTGTDDTGATESDPTGGGASGNNMVLVLANEYDHGNAGGNRLRTRTTRPVSATISRVTDFGYDWRNRRVTTSGELNRFHLTSYDNLGNVVLNAQYQTNTSGLLLAKSEFFFDALGRKYRSKKYGVNSSGTVGNALTESLWFDGRGLLIKRQEMNSRAWNKYAYDGAGRQVASYLSFASTDDGATNSVANDTVVEQTYLDYDAASSVIGTRKYLRFSDATGLGALNGPTGSQPKSRIYYEFQYQDGIGRQIATANYGTNGGSAPTRPSTVPTSSDTLLVSQTVYDAAGNVTETIDPAGIRSKTYYDALNRQTKTVENYTGATSPGTSDTDKTTEYSYSLDGAMSMLTVKNSITGDQVTRWVYGTTLTDSGVASSKLLRAKIYPDSDDATNPLNNGADSAYDRVEYTYNRQSEIITQKDQNGTVHTYIYDQLGQLTEDQVTTLGAGIDGTIRSIKTTYDDLGRKTKVSSAYSSGGVANEVGFTYDDFGQIIEDNQSHSGSVTLSTPKISYSYENGSNNTIRKLAINYYANSGAGVSYRYGDAGSIDDALSRIQEIRDYAGSSALASYNYLGANTFVRTSYADIGTELTYLKQGTEADGDAGDAYNGLDRFGRIQDQRWLKTSTGAELVRLQYGYTRQSLRKWRKDLVAGSDQDEFYTYDGLSQLKERDLGTLNTGRTAISGTPNQEEDWTYDPAGNWRNYLVKSSGSTTLNQDRTQNPANEITSFAGLSAPVGYDKAGNMTSIPYQSGTSPEHYTVVWDAWNRIKRVTYTPGTSSTATPSLDVIYSYDGLFRRTQKQVLAGLQTSADYYWNLDWKCVVQRDYNSTIVRSANYYGARNRNDFILTDAGAGNPHSGVRYYALGDVMFSTMAVIQGTGTSVSERYRYTAFGELTVLDSSYSPTASSATIAVYYHGEYLDKETGWYNYGFRYYLPKMGVWPSRDPIGEEGGNNLYNYAYNNSVNNYDIIGLATILTCCSCPSSYSCAPCADQCLSCSTTIGCADDCERSCRNAKLSMDCGPQPNPNKGGGSSGGNSGNLRNCINNAQQAYVNCMNRINLATSAIAIQGVVIGAIIASSGVGAGVGVGWALWGAAKASAIRYFKGKQCSDELKSATNACFQQWG